MSAIIWRDRNETEAYVCLFNTGQAMSVYIFICNAHNIHSNFHNLLSDGAAEDAVFLLPSVQTMPGDACSLL